MSVANQRILDFVVCCLLDIGNNHGVLTGLELCLADDTINMNSDYSRLHKLLLVIRDDFCFLPCLCVGHFQRHPFLLRLQLQWGDKLRELTGGYPMTIFISSQPGNFLELRLTMLCVRLSRDSGICGAFLSLQPSGDRITGVFILEL